MESSKVVVLDKEVAVEVMENVVGEIHLRVHQVSFLQISSALFGI